MYFSEFSSFNQVIKEATKFVISVAFVDSKVEPIVSNVIGKNGYPAVMEAIAHFHQAREPFMLLKPDNSMVVIPYDQIRTITVKPFIGM